MGLLTLDEVPRMGMIASFCLNYRLNKYEVVTKGTYGYKVKLGNNYGYCDERGRSILDSKYDKIEETPFGFITLKNRKYSFHNISGDTLSLIEFNYLRKTNNGYIVRVDTEEKRGRFNDYKDIKYGYWNNLGKKILPSIYNEIRAVNDSLVVKFDDYYGVLDNNGNEIITIMYDEIMPIENGYIVGYDGYYSFMDKNGQEILPMPSNTKENSTLNESTHIKKLKKENT